MFSLRIICVLSLGITTSYAQNDDSTSFVINLSKPGKDCQKGYLNKVYQKSQGLSWYLNENKHSDYLLESFKNLKENVEKKTKDYRLFNGQCCVQRAGLSIQNDSFKNSYIEVFEVVFNNTKQPQKFVETVQRSNVIYWDNIDVSLPIKFYNKNNSIFIFLDAEDPNEIQFNIVIDKIKKTINDL
jgi:hypothetical protein